MHEPDGSLGGFRVQMDLRHVTFYDIISTKEPHKHKFLTNIQQTFKQHSTRFLYKSFYISRESVCNHEVSRSGAPHKHEFQAISSHKLKQTNEKRA